MTGPVAIDAIRSSLLDMLQQTVRQVDLLSAEFDPLLLDDEAVVDAFLRLARRGRTTRIRIVLSDIRPALESRHRLLTLCRRLPTATTLKLLAQHGEWNKETVMICDRQVGLEVRLDDHRWRTLATPTEAAREAERFDRLWLAAEDSAELRQF